MAPVALDLTPLAGAAARLREGLLRHQGEPADDQLRDGLIQRFEYTYELCHRFLRRFIQLSSGQPRLPMKWTGWRSRT